jgi:nucleotide-binding universal stress UspA family protein
MFREVIAGVDGKSTGRDAAALGRKLAGREGRLTLVNVHGDDSAYRHERIDLPAVESQEALELLARERAAADVDAEIETIEASSVGAGLHAAVKAHGADLLVVGSCSRSYAGRVLLGDDMRAAVDGAPSAVAVAPRGYNEHPMPIARIGVAYNGSPESGDALALAREIAEQQHAAISVLTVVAIPTYSFGTMAAVDWSGVIEGMLADARERIALLEGVDGRAISGIAVEELARFGAEVDLLVVGSRGYGPLHRAVFGSTSAQLTRNAACPLVIVRRAAAEPADADPPALTGVASK